MGPQEPAAGALEYLQFPDRQRRKHSRLSVVELDGARRLALYPGGKYSHCSSLLRERTRSGAAKRFDCLDPQRKGTFARRKEANLELPVRSPRLVPLHGGIPFG